MRYNILPVLFILLLSISADKTLIVSSTAFTNNGSMPALYSCQGKNINPPLHISGMPSGTKSLAIIMHDPDAPMRGGFTHWVLWNIPVTSVIPENYLGAEQGLNSMDKRGYTGMCPPSGTHNYLFKVYALDTELRLDSGTNRAKLEKAMSGHILEEGLLIGLYKKI